VTTSGALLTGVAHGKAIIATALPAFEQILRHGETALLVPYGDVDALAEGLIQLVGDGGLRQRLGGRLLEAQQQIPRWPEIARRTRECYLAALSSPPVWGGESIRT
jgi:glycosyltransferase involved in cell wall biosynthesis